MKKILLIATLVLCANCAIAKQNYNYTQTTTPYYQPQNYVQNTYQMNDHTLKGSIVTVPAGETFKGVFLVPVNSETAVTGQEVTLALGSDFYYNGKAIAPAGSTVIGTVIDASKAKHGSINGKLILRFTHIMTPAGQDIPISAVVKTDDNSGTLLGGTKFDVTKDYAKDIAIGAGVGALAGTIAAPLSDGRIGKGAALMTAVGAGGGLVKSIWDKGSDVEIPINASVDLILTQPITVNPMSEENQSFGE